MVLAPRLWDPSLSAFQSSTLRHNLGVRKYHFYRAIIWQKERGEIVLEQRQSSKSGFLPILKTHPLSVKAKKVRSLLHTNSSYYALRT